MKSEPDRLDLLIVLLPFVLLAVLTFQIVRFVQMRDERAPGSAIAAEVSALLARAPDAQAGEAGRVDPTAARPETPDGLSAEATAVVDAEEKTASQDAVPPESAAILDAAATAGDAAGEDTPAPGASPDAGEPTTAPGAGDPASGVEAPANVIESPEGGTTASPPPPSPSGPGAGESSRPSAGPGPVSPATVGVPIVASTAAPLAASPAPASPADDGPGTPPPSSGGGAGGGGASIQPDDPPGTSGDQVDVSKPAVVTAVPASNTVRVGDVVPVEVRISNGFDVGSVPFHMRYDPKVLAPNASPSSLRGPFLSVPGYDTQFLVAPGPGGNEVVVGLSLMGAPEGPKGSGLLATIYFQAVGPGTSMIQFTRASVRGADARKLPALIQPTVIQVEE